MMKETKQGIITVNNARNSISNRKMRSAWERGVREYAYELLTTLEDGVRGGWIDNSELESGKNLDRAMLNGASSWSEYSWGGCSLINDGIIAARLCTLTELKKTDWGRKEPNKAEQWLDVQARALYQAARMIKEEILADRWNMEK